MRDEYERAEAAAAFIRSCTRLQPRIGVVLGSGHGAWAERLDEANALPFENQIPHFPRPAAEGHAGRLVIGRSGDVPVAVLQGRVHYYEGYSMHEVIFPIRVLGMLGVRMLVLTNSSGGIAPNLTQGQLFLIRDHINLQGASPLRGPNDERFGARFLDLSHAYSERLAAITHEEARKLGIELAEGIYAALPGPNYETPAEIRYLRTIGADVVGMSTVPEVIAARHLGMEVLALSCVSNPAAGLQRGEVSHAEVLAVGERSLERLSVLLRAILARLGTETA